MLPIRWSLLSEFFSLLLLIIICTHYFGYERNTAFTGRRKLFLCCIICYGYNRELYHSR